MAEAKLRSILSDSSILDADISSVPTQTLQHIEQKLYRLDTVLSEIANALDRPDVETQDTFLLLEILLESGAAAVASALATMEGLGALEIQQQKGELA